MLSLKKKLKIKSLVAWSISEGRVDQKQIINFVQPKIFCLDQIGSGQAMGEPLYF